MIRNDDPSYFWWDNPRGSIGAPRSPYDEANTDFLPHSWCWRHKTVLVACVCLAALASSGFMIYDAWHR